MRWRAWSGTATFVIAWALNPALITGCARLGFTYDFGEAEVVALVDAAGRAGPYRFRSEGREVEVSFALVQVKGPDRSSSRDVPLTRSAHACGDRTFLRSAGACLDTTSLPLVGTMTVKAVAGATLLDHVPVTGSLIAMGTRLSHVQLTLVAGHDGVGLASTDGRTFTVKAVNIGGTGATPQMP